MSTPLYIHRYRLALREGSANARSQRREVGGFLIRSGEGFGCVHPWPELGDPTVEELLAALRDGKRHRLLDRALSCAVADGAGRRAGRSLFEEEVLRRSKEQGSSETRHGELRCPQQSKACGLQGSLPSRAAAGSGTAAGTAALWTELPDAHHGGISAAARTIPLSHAIITGDADYDALAAAGFTAVKLKTHGGDASIVKRVQAAVEAGLRVRIDCNGTGIAALRSLRPWAERVDFIEDPEPYDSTRWREIRAELGMPLALDRLEGADSGGYDVRVLKPALETCEPRSLPVVFTSYMDHPLGQMFAAWEASRYTGQQLEAGLLTHLLFEPDAFIEAVRSEGPQLLPPGGTGLGFDALLEALPWERLSRPARLMMNPRAPLDDPPDELPDGCLVFPTSGSTGAPALVCLSREAMLANAAAVNDWLGAAAGDVWLRALPEFHVGGMSIHFRAELSGSRVVVDEEKWDAVRFVRLLEAEGITLTSLVPSQVFDLVRSGQRSPVNLRAVIVGGGALEDSLFQQALLLGWPLLPSYGMTEASSQVATARPGGDGRMELLPCWEARVNHDGRLQLRGTPLLSGRMVRTADGWKCQPALDADGWFTTNDRAALDGRFLTPLGRCDRLVKVLGELVDLDALESEMHRAGLPPDAGVVIALPDERAGVRPWLVTDFPGADAVIVAANEALPPFARIAGVRRMELPRSPLGKVLRAAITVPG